MVLTRICIYDYVGKIKWCANKIHARYAVFFFGDYVLQVERRLCTVTYGNPLPVPGLASCLIVVVCFCLDSWMCRPVGRYGKGGPDWRPAL